MKLPFFHRAKGSPAVTAESHVDLREARGSIAEKIGSSANLTLAQIFGVAPPTQIGVSVTPESAMTVPAVFAAVLFLCSSIASLPIGLYTKDPKTGEKTRITDDPLSHILNDAVNDETTAFDFFFQYMLEVLTYGRSVAFIERNGRGDPINLWPLLIQRVNLERRWTQSSLRLIYHFQDGTRPVTFAASEVLDVRFLPQTDPLIARSPMMVHRDTIALAIAATRYGAEYFANGGVPPFVITGPFSTPAAISRAKKDVKQALQDARDSGEMAVSLPDGHKLTPVGFDPEKMQMIETKRFLIEEIARIFYLPPVFLQDLTHGTYSNAEQQDLVVVKHTLAHWVARIEQQLNLKLFGRDRPGARFVEFNLDGLLRGDLVSRMAGITAAVAGGVLTPNEGRAMDNRPKKPGGDDLYMNGGSAPLTTLGKGAVNAG